MSFVDNQAPFAPEGIPDEDVIVAFQEDDPNEELNVEIIEDGSALVGYGEEESVGIPDDLPHNANLAAYIDDDELQNLASELIEAYETDKSTRNDWLNTFTEGLKDLGFDRSAERKEPFDGASAVFHPLLAEAATQFQSQAYKELLPAGGPVSTKTVGSTAVQGDPEKNKPIIDIIDQANRVREFMNYQITEVMEEYDPELDQMLFYLALSGSSFKKIYFDETLGRAVSKYCTAEDVVVNYYATDLDTVERITHRFILSKNELRRHQVFGTYRETDVGEAGEPEINAIQEAIDGMHGVSQSQFLDDEYMMLEMHVNLDLAGFENEYGLMLPYIVTICKDTGDIMSITRNWAEGDDMYKRNSYFVHYKFLPGLGFYGFGLIHMIGDLALSATSIMRQLIDAGTFANLPGGFKQRGVRFSDDPVSPAEWRDVDAPGGTINTAFMPLPYKEPSAVLFQLLGLVIESGRRFASIADTTISESGSQQNPVGTTMALIERGSKVMSAIHKRLHYAQKKEFKILARIIADYLPPEYPYSVGGMPQMIKKNDFSADVDVIPVSDPNIFSMTQRAMLAQQQLQMAQANPEIHNLRESYRRMYSALEIKNPEDLLRAEHEPEQLTPAAEHAAVLENKKIMAFEGQDHQAHIQAHIAFARLPTIQQNPDFYTNLVQDIMNHIKFMAQAQAQQQVMQQAQQMQGNPMVMQQLQAQIPQIVTKVESQMIGQIMQQLAPQQPDPMKEMHDKEMQIKQQDSTMRNQIEQVKLQTDAQKSTESEITKRMKIIADEQKANQDTAQKREAAFINAGQKSEELYQKSIIEAQKNDLATQQIRGQQNANTN